MSRWRFAVIGALFTLPLLALIGFGSWFLWERGWWFFVWWPLAGSMALAYFLAWHWQKQRRLLPVLEAPPNHWTDRDQAAWKLVESRAEQARNIPLDKLGDPNFYSDAAVQMAEQLSRHYRAGADEPLDHVTIPEILSVIELAAHDLNKTVSTYLPAGHLMTIADWKRAQQATEWYQRASTAYWATAGLFQPVQTATRFAAAQLGLATPWKMLQQNLIDWFYMAYLQRLGTYMIELYSGRLRAGVKKYREVLLPEMPNVHATPANKVTVILFGQVKAGKSSLVNALLGDQKAKTDILPSTTSVTRYQLAQKDGPTLEILDTVGFGHEGPKADDLKTTLAEAEASDLLLLVMHARNPAHAADVKFVDELHKWFDARPNLKVPAVIAVVSHIDLLTPAVEWSPPYDWHRPKRPKEVQIQQAVLAVREQLGDRVDAVVPVCTAPGKFFGIKEELFPVVAAKLGEARAVAMIRVLTAEGDAHKVRKVFEQIGSLGQQLLTAALQSAIKK